MTRNEMQARVDNLAKASWARYTKQFGITNPVPTIKLNGRFTRTWGCCYYERNQIDLSVKGLTEQYDLMVKQVLPHELAHMITYIIHPEAYACKPMRHHGQEWQSIMRAIGQNPSTFLNAE